MRWYGDKVITELRKAQGRNLTRAAIHLARKIKENLSVSGRQGGIEEGDIRREQIIRTGLNERGRRTVTVSQKEFHRIVDPINKAKRRGVRRKLGRRRRKR